MTTEGGTTWGAGPEGTGTEEMRTEQRLRRCFREMFCEMPFKEITVTGLTERAGVSRKTFYNHYRSVEELLRQEQKEYIELTRQYDRMKDTDPLTRIYMDYVDRTGEFGEHLWGDADNHYYYFLASSDTMREMWPDRHRNADVRQRSYENIVLHYIQLTTVRAYRQWLRAGKPVPMRELTDQMVSVLCSGMQAGSGDRETR